MAVDENTRIVRELHSTNSSAEVPQTEQRQGQVVSVQSDGTATVTIGGDPEPVAGVHSDSNYVPTAGDTVWLEVSDTDVTILRKNGTSPSALAGFRTSAQIDTSEPRSATTYGDLATVGPSVAVTVGDSGILLVHIRARVLCLSDNDGGIISFALSGANTLAASNANRISFFGGFINGFAEFGDTFPLTGLTPGLTTVTMKYSDAFDVGNDVEYARRRVWAMPL